MSKHGSKLLVVSFEAIGKTTLVSNMKDALLMSTDNKRFMGNTPHFRYAEYEGFHNFTETMNSKIAAYKEKFGDYPKTIIIDSITHLTGSIERYCNNNYTGFNIYSNLSKDILALNAYLENTILANGVNVVLTAHTQYDEASSRYIIPAAGSFQKSGSWLSVVDNAVYIGVKNGKRVIYHSDLKFPCRTLLDLPISQPLEEYNINEHMSMLEHQSEESSQNTI